MIEGWNEAKRARRDGWEERLLKNNISVSKTDAYTDGFHDGMVWTKQTLESLSPSQQIQYLMEENKRLKRALCFYADPETYFAIGFFPDPPCGEFMDDFHETQSLGHKPGKRAWEALRIDERTPEWDAFGVRVMTAFEETWASTSPDAYQGERDIALAFFGAGADIGSEIGIENYAQKIERASQKE